MGSILFNNVAERLQLQLIKVILVNTNYSYYRLCKEPSQREAVSGSCISSGDGN